ncbi:alanine racemase [Ascidiimonas sp. W6]|uniref:alanine racemase n=1 Tax=Ascidiimonas meishanensis TaxID=3128903 RepID=UPI0030EF460E
MPEAVQTVLEIDLAALKHNFDFLKSKVAPETHFLAVVKAFAYGNDSQKIAQFLEKCGVDYFAVAYVSEGVALRDAGITTPILVLHPQAANLDVLVDRCLEPSLYNAFIFEEFIKIARQKKQQDYPVHIKFNTGLNRLGFEETQLSYISKIIKQTPEIYIKSLFSHLAASEDKNEAVFTRKQINSFLAIANQFSEQTELAPILHLANTSGILNYPEAHLNMVRSGIGLYGYGNDAEFDQFLKPIATLKTGISQIHHIKKGSSVGYNRSFIAKTATKIATLPIGHADGIGRQYGQRKGFVTIKGQKAFIIGNVCMDMLMVDITHINCKEGDEVIVFGPHHSADRLAATANTISYEIITGISTRVKRVFLNDT